MRISKKKIEIIKQTAMETFGTDCKVWIFGSRVDDTKRGGDIDIFIEIPHRINDKVKKEIKFLAKLKRELGDQKIDLVVRVKGEDDFISREAKQKGVEII